MKCEGKRHRTRKEGSCSPRQVETPLAVAIPSSPWRAGEEQRGAGVVGECRELRAPVWMDGVRVRAAFG
jgi:hypothetical protein